MGKNSQIHVYVDTETLESLKLQARNLGIALSDLCRKKLGECVQLDRIEATLKEVNNKLNLNSR